MKLGSLLFLDISSGELIIIILAIVLIFGPRKIPDIARQLGKGMNEVRRVTNDIRREIREESNKVKDDLDPNKTEKKDETA